MAAPTPETLPDVSTLPSLPSPALTGMLDLLFEPSPELHTLAVPTMRTITFTSYPELIDTVRDQLLAVAADLRPDPDARLPLLAILSSHPRLGEKKVASAQSRAEQAQLSAAATAGAGGGQEEADELARLNREYEARFPGLRYVVFVNGRARPAIFADMRRRIARGDTAIEEKEAIQAMADIAKDRANKLQKAAGA